VSFHCLRMCSAEQRAQVTRPNVETQVQLYLVLHCHERQLVTCALAHAVVARQLATTCRTARTVHTEAAAQSQCCRVEGWDILSSSIMCTDNGPSSR
jgi:hypothetical protein